MSSLCAVIEKAPIHVDRNKSTDEVAFSDKHRRKEGRKETEEAVYQLSGLTLPSVKGASEGEWMQLERCTLTGTFSFWYYSQDFIPVSGIIFSL